MGEGDSLAEEVRQLICDKLVSLLPADCGTELVVWPAQVTELRKEIALALDESTDDAIVEELRRAKGIVEGHGPGGDLRKLCKQKTPALLSLLVGARTNVVTLQVPQHHL